MATRLDATVGSRVSMSISGEGQAAGFRVVGIYRNQDQEAVRPYWCSYTNLFQNPSYGNDSTPPPLVIATDAATFQAVRDSYGGSSTDSWVSPAETTDITLTQGQAIADKQAAAYAAAGVTPSQRLADLNSGTGRMPEFVERTALTRDGLRGPVLPIALGGSILALLLVGAAGSYWADRRSREVRLLSSRGVGPGALAAQGRARAGAAGDRRHRAGLAGRPLAGRAARPEPAAGRGRALAGRADRPGRAGGRARAARPGRRAAVPGGDRTAGRRPPRLGHAAALGTADPGRRGRLLAAAARQRRGHPRRRHRPDQPARRRVPAAVPGRRRGAGGAAARAAAAPAGPVRRPAVPGLVSGRPPGHRLPGDQRDPARRRLPPDRHARLRRHPHPDLPLHPRRQGRADQRQHHDRAVGRPGPPQRGHRRGRHPGRPLPLRQGRRPARRRHRPRRSTRTPSPRPRSGTAGSPTTRSPR